MGVLTFRIDEELEKAIRGQAKLEQKTLSNFIIETLKERLENEDDYKLAMASYDTIDINDSTTLKDLCDEIGIDYNEL